MESLLNHLLDAWSLFQSAVLLVSFVLLKEKDHEAFDNLATEIAQIKTMSRKRCQQDQFEARTKTPYHFNL